MDDDGATLNEFIAAACVSRDGAHTSGDLATADALLAANPGIAVTSIHAAAVLGDEALVRRYLAADGAAAAEKGGPFGWDPLTYLCFSRYLRLAPERSEGFVRTATALLEAGADPSGGWWEDRPVRTWESVLYGAAGFAHHAALTRVLLEFGADPNDDETTYHAPESRELGVVVALIESGRLSADSLATMLLRKTDWHDRAGVALLLDAGADPARDTRWGGTALHWSIRRDNEEAIVELLLDRRADPARPSAHGESSAALAARRGRGDLLRLFRRRGVPVPLEGADALLAHCALNERDAAFAEVEGSEALRQTLMTRGGEWLGPFAGNGNVEGVRLLLELGVPVDAQQLAGDGYFGVAPRSTALHVAAWRAQHDVLRLLLHAGAAIDARDGEGRTPLALAVRACVDSFWMGRRSPASVEALLAAGASASAIALPTGYDAIDELLRAARH